MVIVFVVSPGANVSVPVLAIKSLSLVVAVPSTMQNESFTAWSYALRRADRAKSARPVRPLHGGKDLTDRLFNCSILAEAAVKLAVVQPVHVAVAVEVEVPEETRL